MLLHGRKHAKEMKPETIGHIQMVHINLTIYMKRLE
jgi:hypothetical protein